MKKITNLCFLGFVLACALSLVTATLAAGQASFFLYEEEKMYTKRESELLQNYLSQHGRLPKGNDLPDDLF